MGSEVDPGEAYTKYHKDGSIWAKGRTIEGVPTGYWEWFRKDGTKLRSGHFEDGEQVGEWITYDHAPATTGFRCRLPVGAVLRVYAEPSRFSFTCTVDDPEVESQVVPASAFNDAKYAGAAFSFGYGELGRRLALITE